MDKDQGTATLVGISHDVARLQRSIDQILERQLKHDEHHVALAKAYSDKMELVNARISKVENNVTLKSIMGAFGIVATMLFEFLAKKSP